MAEEEGAMVGLLDLPLAVLSHVVLQLNDEGAEGADALACVAVTCRALRDAVGSLEVAAPWEGRYAELRTEKWALGERIEGVPDKYVDPELLDPVGWKRLPARERYRRLYKWAQPLYDRLLALKSEWDGDEWDGENLFVLEHLQDKLVDFVSWAFFVQPERDFGHFTDWPHDDIAGALVSRYGTAVWQTVGLDEEVVDMLDNGFIHYKSRTDDDFLPALAADVCDPTPVLW